MGGGDLGFGVWDKEGGRRRGGIRLETGWKELDVGGEWGDGWGEVELGRVGRGGGEGG